MPGSTTLIVPGTVMSNAGLEYYLKSLNLNLARSAVGGRYVLEEMRSYPTLPLIWGQTPFLERGRAMMVSRYVEEQIISILNQCQARLTGQKPGSSAG